MTYKEKKEFSDPRTVLLEKYCPSGTLQLVDIWLSSRPFHLRVSRERVTKLGDYRPGVNGQFPRISVNQNLHPVEFIITLAHEIAHFDVYRKYKRRKKPHGEEWKEQFRLLLRELIESDCLSPDMNDAILRCYFFRERIASSGCMYLKTLLEEDLDDHVTRVGDLEEGERFYLRNGKAFIRGEKLRVRYRCKEITTGRFFTVHQMAEVVKKGP